ncbi:hypothetical protein ACYBSK_08875 [Streptomyces sp. BYX5S]
MTRADHRRAGDDTADRRQADFERHLSTLLDGYANDAPVRTDTLVAGGLTRGRRMRARRRALWGAGTAACAGALTVVVLVSGGAPNPAPSQASGVTIPDFSPAAASASGTPLTGKQAVTELRGLLPDNGTTGARWWDGAAEDAKRPAAGGRLLLHGTEVTVSVQGNFQLTAADALTKEAARESSRATDKSGAVSPDKSAAARHAEDGKRTQPASRAQLRTFYSCPARSAPGTTLSDCSARNLSDGSVLLTYQERHGDLVQRTADLLRKDGTRVVLTAANAENAKKGPPNTPTPPLTSTELSDLARSTTWHPWSP